MMSKIPLCKHKKSTAAFTLLELAIVMLISSFIITAMLYAYKLYTADNFLKESRVKQELIQAAISSYQARTAISNGELPCPSDISLPPNDPMVGWEDCTLHDGGSPIGTCTAGGGLCIVAGFRDTDADPDVLADPVLIGGVPYKTLGLTLADSDGDEIGDTLSSGGVIDEVNYNMAIDPWGYQMTYAVSAHMTEQTTNKNEYGTINIRTELGTNISDPAGSAHYAIIAHGNNHAGAFTLNGVVGTTCAAVAGMAEEENCDGDAEFVRGLRTMVPGANYYDDTVSDRSFSISRIWEFVGGGSTDIYNLNIGNVGIGTLTPSQRLEITGDLRAWKISQSLICETGGIDCFDPDSLGSAAGTKCTDTNPPAAPGNIWVMKGVKSGLIDCEEIPLATVLTSQSCAVATEYVVGFDSSGNIICE